MLDRRVRRKLLQVLLKKELYEIDPQLEAMPESFSPAYVLLVQQHVRRRFVRAFRDAATIRVWRLPWKLADLALRWSQLAVTNALVASYLNETALRSALEEGRAREDRDPQA
ncbi:MAG: hypothetical protein U0167_01670 [bacterium]